MWIVIGLILPIVLGVLTRVGAVTPLISGAVGISVGLRVGSIELIEVIAIGVCCYLVSYWSATRLEVNGISLDMNTILVNNAGAGKVNTKVVVLIRMTVFLVFLLLPISKPSSYITGLPALLLTTLLFLCSSTTIGMKVREFIVIFLQSLIYGGIIYVMNKGGETGYVVGMISGMSIARYYLGGRKKSNEDSVGEVVLPGLFRVITIMTLVWLTPGLSLSGLSANLLNNDRFRPILNLWLSTAIEGWSLHTLLSGLPTGKSVLADQLVNIGMGLVKPNPMEYGLIVIAVLYSIGVGIFLEDIDIPDRYAGSLSISGIFLQSIVSIGVLWTIVFVIAGWVIQRVRMELEARDESISLGFLMPIVVSS